MADWRPAIMMGAPGAFQIRGGANPHTRDRWGRRKSVDRVLTLRQWNRLASALTDRGVQVFVVPADPERPGLVFPANAGYLSNGDERRPLSEKPFYLSTTLPTRSREKEIFRRFVEGLGFQTRDVPKRFEGEADLIRAGDVYLFTSGRLERQRFLPRFGWPPYRRAYGFRSDAAALPDVERMVDRPVIPLTLVRETHYHGDTCLCAFGPAREFLMVYPPALAADSFARLKAHFKDRLLPLSEEDGETFAANSFQVGGKRPTVFIPHRATAALQNEIRSRGVDPVPVDVSEFMEKGGGSVKCLIGDLGLLNIEESVPSAVKTFRETNRLREDRS